MPAVPNNFVPDNSALLRVQHRLWRSAVLRRLLPWLMVLAPWLFLRSVSAALLGLIFAALDFIFIKRKIASEWVGWINAEVPQMEDSVELLFHANTVLAQLQQRRILQRVDQALDSAAIHRIARQHLRRHQAWNAGLIAAIEVDIARGGDQQFIHCAMNQLAAQDMSKCMQNSGYLNRDGEEQCLLQSVSQAELAIQQIEQNV